MTDDLDTPILTGSQQVASCAVDATVLIKAMAHQGRMSILCHLIEGEKSVGQLADLLGIRDSTASQHLALLRRDRLIAGRRDGQTVWYSIESKSARQVVEVLYESFCVPAIGAAAAAARATS